jgi:hypothetical protein
MVLSGLRVARRSVVRSHACIDGRLANRGGSNRRPSGQEEPRRSPSLRRKGGAAETIPLSEQSFDETLVATRELEMVDYGGRDATTKRPIPSDCSPPTATLALSNPAEARVRGASTVGVMPVRTTLLAAATGVLVANLFSTQPVIAQIAAGVGMPIASAGLVPMLTMLGYASGLMCVLPLIDKFENRRLMLVSLAASVLALAMAALAPGTAPLLTAAFLVGATSCSLQMIVVMAATLSSEAQRGRVVGGVMSGLMLGVLLAHPAGSLIAGALGWRAVYATSAIAVAIVMMLLARSLARRGSGPAVRAQSRRLPVSRRRKRNRLTKLR